ncbi:MAG: thioredoxin domain-containing protein [Anaerolineae bacterium]|nr:thioredoxin domain-containing protein [Anaerolineae bacterium]
MEDYAVENSPMTDSRAQRTTTASRSAHHSLTLIIVFLVGMLVGWLLFGRSDKPQTVYIGMDAQLADDDPAFGPADAPITMVEFSDFNCPVCARFTLNTLPQIQSTYGDQIRYVYRDMPIIGGSVSVQTAIAAECAADDGKFWEFHHLLFSNTQARSPEAYIGFADELGLNTSAYTTCLSDQAKYDEVILDLVYGQARDIRGTPAFYVNGQLINGAMPFEIFRTVINNELNKVGIQPPA